MTLLALNGNGKDEMRILLLEGIHNSAIENLHRAGYHNIQIEKKALPEDELVEIIPDVHVLGIRSTTNLTERVFDAAEKLLTVGAFCIGTNQIDLNTAMNQGIPVFNAPFSNTRSVAELVIAEIIFLMRGIAAKNFGMHRNLWMKSAANSHEIRGKTLGIIGYGNIGSQLSVLAESLGMKVIFYDIVSKLPIGNAKQVPNLEQLLDASDIVTLHVPETELTKNMINQDQLNLMKDSGLLINASRGTVVDLEALTDAIESKHLGGAAIDVYPVEPKSEDEPFIHNLCNYDNVILTPHVAGSTLEAQENIGREVSEKLVTYLDIGSTLSAVNFPEVNLPPQEGKHRILHVHRNVPGVLSSINKVFGEAEINIAAQYLQTNATIGYVVIDLDAEYSQLALKMLREVNGTIRVRALM
ncbi:MAG TPA: phosphoglycerate dehydrogenase [Candidatus Lokiarchaeia archaeon]|nr:phosphoglycerate dehydrogenase [Candidatus Lokiarchaeia archaeon]